MDRAMGLLARPRKAAYPCIPVENRNADEKHDAFARHKSKQASSFLPCDFWKSPWVRGNSRNYASRDISSVTRYNPPFPDSLNGVSQYAHRRANCVAADCSDCFREKNSAQGSFFFKRFTNVLMLNSAGSLIRPTSAHSSGVETGA